MAIFLSALSVMVAAVYSYLTYRILRSNQETVAAMRKQAEQEQQFHIRAHFLSGIGAIAQYDTDSPGCEQAMRLLDYYASLAMSSDDPELLHILNTVMTAEIRKKLEEIQEQKQEIYINAVAARTRIQTMLKDYHMKRKNLMPK